MLNKSLLILQKYPHFILAGLGLALGILINLIERFTPNPLHSILYNVLTLILIVNGLVLGLIIRGLYRNVYHDSLTGLGNKGMFYVRLKLEMAQVKNSSDLCLALLDLDNFKHINDSFGHLAGDMVLKKIGIILKENMRGKDISVRWGGEEFAIIMPNTDVLGSTKLLERIRTIIESYDFGPEINSHQITVSTGVISTMDLKRVINETKVDINPLDLFVNLADKALYRAKIPKNAIVTWDVKYDDL